MTLRIHTGTSAAQVSMRMLSLFVTVVIAHATRREVVAYVETKLDDDLWRSLPWDSITTVVNIKGDTAPLVATALLLRRIRRSI